MNPRGHTIQLQFYATAPYPCSYLPDQLARSQVAVPSELIDTRTYSQLVQHGFRRSGQFVYRPHCDACQACVPVRLPVAEFEPNRTQRRAARHHANLKTRILGLEYSEAHFRLYQRYQAARHSGGGMDEDGREQYESFILKSNVASFLAEFREAGVVRMVSLVDQLEDGLSSVYTFYDPDIPGSSYGVFNILWQVGLARQLGLPYVYLGYWIEACRKMAYKTQYHPIEGLIDGRWGRLEL
ncbi:putative arginyl-tRNA--protein transferase [Chitiniphilus shinanonensis]|uniref:Aspartate/glutamate leucyltransferase n=1 Tax=Chitiniphilus shinanonensis TaxID=553088 RepID=A0ABQ6BV34_9NEIS|nr:arginyltransferase [Chitiniphilus shinanonensis]GLS05206.1 putative arginyl-tRNA--protein transferase [Chitiniphilus shinanonensis]